MKYYQSKFISPLVFKILFWQLQLRMRKNKRNHREVMRTKAFFFFPTPVPREVNSICVNRYKEQCATNLGMWQYKNRDCLCLEVHRTSGRYQSTGHLQCKILPSPLRPERKE